MGYDIKVNSDALKNDSRSIEDLIVSAESQIEKIYQEVEVLDSMWEGPANEEFRRQFGVDYKNFKAVCKYIKEFSADLEKAATEYERCEDAVKSAIKAIKV